MKRIAAILTHNELDRYLPVVVPDLLGWVDEIRVRDDGSTDHTAEYLETFDRVEVLRRPHTWQEHEGRAQAELLEWTLAGEPTHVLTIDADEVVPEGEAVRAVLEADQELDPEPIAYTLRMVELWGLDPPVMRVDGGWAPHPKPVLYRVPPEVLRVDAHRPPPGLAAGAGCRASRGAPPPGDRDRSRDPPPGMGESERAPGEASALSRARRRPLPRRLPPRLDPLGG